MVAEIERTAKPLFSAGKFVLALGGEHTVSVGLIKACHKKFPKLSVLQVDAHADLRESYQGSHFSHACAMRHVVDMGIPLAAVGIRNYSADEYRFMRKTGLTPTDPRMIRDYPKDLDMLVNKYAAWTQLVLDKLSEDVYITVDIDAFDPAYAPGTGTPEPGGLNWFEVTGLLREVCMNRRVVGADIVEVSPTGKDNVTEFLAARLAYKIITYTQAADKKSKRKG
jgi:agmatinase